MSISILPMGIVAEAIKYAIRLPANRVLQERIKTKGKIGLRRQGGD
jgi:hypothetical protein